MIGSAVPKCWSTQGLPWELPLIRCSPSSPLDDLDRPPRGRRKAWSTSPNRRTFGGPLRRPPSQINPLSDSMPAPGRIPMTTFARGRCRMQPPYDLRPASCAMRHALRTSRPSRIQTCSFQPLPPSWPSAETRVATLLRRANDRLWPPQSLLSLHQAAAACSHTQSDGQHQIDGLVAQSHMTYPPTSIHA